MEIINKFDKLFRIADDNVACIIPLHNEAVVIWKSLFFEVINIES